MTITDVITGNFTLATEYFWTVPGAVGTLTSANGGQSITIQSAAATGSGNISVLNRYVDNTSNGTRCNGTARTLGVNVRARPTVNIAPDPANICEGSTIQLNGNPTTTFGTISSHTWGGNTTILDADNIQQPTVQASATAGTYNLTYVATADFGGGVFCNSTVDNSVVNISANPTPASTGPNQFLCQALLTSNPLGGSNPSPGTGTWTLVNRPTGSSATNAGFSPDQNTPNATFTGDINGQYLLRWTVVNGSCTSSSDIIVDFGTDPGVQNAGTNNSFCGLTGSLNAVAPIIGNITSWTQIAQPVGGVTTFTPAAPTIPNPAIEVKFLVPIPTE
ncbi:hypothetical protein QQ054_00290 [Oscillatoria amoena NRMC-F 0135]|nr:hypothetical protein [Oscillatoria amoena NRMC-F 0135]